MFVSDAREISYGLGDTYSGDRLPHAVWLTQQREMMGNTLGVRASIPYVEMKITGCLPFRAKLAGL